MADKRGQKVRTVMTHSIHFALPLDIGMNASKLRLSSLVHLTGVLRSKLNYARLRLPRYPLLESYQPVDI